MKRITVIILFLFCLIGNNPIICFAQAPTASQIERSQENLEKERALRETIERGEKVFVKKIIVKGITLLTGEQIKEIIMPFQKHWLTKDDIQRLLDLLRQAYQQKSQQIPTISYQVKERKLIISVEEKKS